MAMSVLREKAPFWRPQGFCLEGPRATAPSDLGRELNLFTGCAREPSFATGCAREPSFATGCARILSFLEELLPSVGG